MKQTIAELYGRSTTTEKTFDWDQCVKGAICPYLDRKCLKTRKSQADITIGTCTVNYGKARRPIAICPHRLLQRRQIFTDALHLLSLHRPGNELHVVPEVPVPGGSVDYFIVSAKRGKPVDFVGVELQTLDATGTAWPARARFLDSLNLACDSDALLSESSYGMNWKMTAKTILVQLHHKIETFSHLSKHLVLVTQDCLLEYMQRSFSFDHLNQARNEDSMHFHAYSLDAHNGDYRLELANRMSTDVAGIELALGLKSQATVDLPSIFANLEHKMSDSTRWTPA